MGMYHCPNINLITDFLAFPWLIPELFTCTSITTIPAGLRVGNLTSAKGYIYMLQAAEAPEDTTLNGKDGLVPEELHNVMGGLLCSSCFAVQTCSLFYTAVQTIACGGIQKKSQIHKSQANILMTGLYPLLSESQANAKITKKELSRLHISHGSQMI